MYMYELMFTGVLDQSHQLSRDATLENLFRCFQTLRTQANLLRHITQCQNKRKPSVDIQVSLAKDNHQTALGMYDVQGCT